MGKNFVCEVLNNEDQRPMTISSEWSTDEIFKITVLREGTVPLRGQTTVDQQLQEYPRSEVSKEQAILDIQDELSGNDTRVQFVLRGPKLSWKMNLWWKGGVKVEPIENITLFANICQRWLSEQANSYRAEEEMRRENEALRRSHTELVAKLNSLEISKKRMEDFLYTRFLSVLNEKKKKIKQLEERLKACDSGMTVSNERSVYDEDTEDERENNSNDETKTDVCNVIPSVSGTNVNKTQSVTNSEDLLNQRFSFSSESEQDDIELRFPETQDSLNSKMEEEEEEPDLFSQ
ncbi:DNA repair protein XRCC4-like [Venturia canescens]|uniref:DNA repair protein XRCC4-like n=1 Tax=Venturia canescens TaxID=32260 RepID=UPI001C9BCC81|nr:DNA repair protein XRCC4-like [Venturia canescens]